MQFKGVVVSTGHLVSDDGNRTAVEFSVALIIDPRTGRTRPSGRLTGDFRALGADGNLRAPSLVTQHFGTVLIQLHEIGTSSARFTITEGFDILGLDPPSAPLLAAIDGEVPPQVPSSSEGLDHQAR